VKHVFRKRKDTSGIYRKKYTEVMIDKCYKEQKLLAAFLSLITDKEIKRH
jgi:hypothetical protein